MEIVKASKDNPEPDLIERASQILLAGGLIIYPSDTVYSLAANALLDEPVRRIFEVKGREEGKPIHVLVKDLEMINDLVVVNNLALKLIKEFYPGFLNLVLKDKGKASRLLTAQTGTLGVRIPNFKLTQMLSEQSGIPYTGTSANPSGGKSPYSVAEVLNQFSPEKLALVDLILDAGVLAQRLPSTVLDLTKAVPRLVREGPVSRQRLEDFLGMPLG